MTSKSRKWFVDINAVRTDYIVIEDLEQFKSPTPPSLHPNHPDYSLFWAKEIKKCIEGIWGKEFSGYRYMPGRLYFFGNYGVLEHTNESKNTISMKPKIVDYFWDFAYMSTVCYGFSGFSKDDEYNCRIELKLYYEGFSTELPEESLNKQGQPKKYIPPYEYITMIHDKKKGKALYGNPTSNNMILGCHSKGTKIRMYDGTLKSVENIKEGELLMGIDSKPRKVIETHSGKEKMFKIEQSHGESYIVNENHILRVSTRNQKKEGVERYDIESNITVKDYLQKSESWKKRTQGVMSKGIEFPEQNLKVNPYLLGLWLGDGFKREKLICGSYEDIEILNWLKEYCTNTENYSYTVTDYQGGLGNKKLWRFRFINNNWLTKNNWWAKTFRNNKHIPNNYLISSKKQRLELLAGFIDSDGCYEDKAHRFTITNIDLNLLKQTQELARSLGFTAVINKPSNTGNTNSLKYNLRIYGNIHTIPTKIKRKQAKKIINKIRHRNKLTITELEEDNYYGFEINGDHLYLLEDYTITHNSRGGGKSYWAAIGELEYNFVFDGAKTYEDFTEGVRSLQCVGSSDTNKSSEMLEKFLTSQLAKTTNSNKNYVKWFGIWTEIKGEEEIIYACPLYIKSLGSIAPSNKSNKFRDAYKKKVGNKYQEVGGTGSAIAHVNYSIKKGDGAQAAAGGRYLYSNIEEVGLVENFVDVLGSNEGTIARVGTRFGVQSAQGTSGNIEFIQAAKKVFLDPLSYFMLPFENKNGTEGADGKICYFIPYYMTLFKYKDENGNTNFERAIEHVNREREQKSKSKDPRVLRNFTMNKPCYTHEMWQTDQGYYLPSEEASVRERELMAGEMYRQLMTPVELVWDDSQQSGVNYRILHNVEPITDFPIPKDLKDPSGCVVIYEMPEPNAPPDLYNFVGHDPYVEEDITKGGSLGVTYILKNPKYIPQGHTGNIIVASYIGKPIKGLDYYYEQQEKLIAFYGNAIESLWYEKNRGEYCRAYYMKRNKMHLLARTPQYSTGSNIYQRNITSTGFLVGANGSIAKKNLLKMVKDWLLEETAFTVDDNTTSKMNIFRLNCIFLVRQIAQFDIDGNFDAVSAFIGCILGLREYEILLTESIQSQQDQTQDYFGNLLSNKRLFNTDYFK